MTFLHALYEHYVCFSNELISIKEENVSDS